MFSSKTRNLAYGLMAVLFVFGPTTYAGETEAAPSLYERLGGMEGINQVVRDTIAFHKENPEISHFFKNVDVDQLAAHVSAFFAAGTGGPANYEGRDMTTTHANMGLSDADFDSAVADVLKAVDKNGLGATERAEVAAILESLRPAVMGTPTT